jgi:hypothetical protein
MAGESWLSDLLSASSSSSLLQQAIAAAVATQGAIGEVRKVESGDLSLELICKSGSATVNGVTVLASFADRHWRKIKNGAAALILAIGGQDMTDIVQDFFDYGLDVAGNEGSLPPGDYRVTSTLYVRASATANCTRVKCGGGGGQAGRGAKIYYDGVTDSPLLTIQARDFSFSGISFECGAGRTITNLVTFDFELNEDDEPVGVASRPTFTDCGFGTRTTGSCDYLFVVDSQQASNFNLEEGRFYDCVFANFNKAAIRFRGGQPYAWKFYDCGWENDKATASGRGILFDTASCSVSIVNPTVGRLSTFLYFNAGAGCSVTGYVDLENCKRFAYSGFGINTGRPLTISPGRFDFTQYNAAATEPAIAADDNDFIVWGFGAGIHMSGCDAQGGQPRPLPDAGILLTPQVPFIADNCVFWNRLPVKRGGGFAGDERPGGTYLRACKYLRGNQSLGDGVILDRLPDRHGCENHDDEITITGTQTTLVIALDTPEVSTDYIVTANVVRTTGAATTARARVTARTLYSFTLELDAAPGSDTATISYTLRLKDSQVSNAVRAIAAGASNTLYGTAVGAGLVGSASGCWAGATYYKTANPAGVSQLFGAGDYFAAQGFNLGIGTDGAAIVEAFGAGPTVQSLNTGGASGALQTAGRCHAILAYLDAAGRVGCYINRIHYPPAGTAITYVPGTAVRTVIGNLHSSDDDLVQAGFTNTVLPVLGVVGGNGVLTADEISRWFDKVGAGDVAPSIAGKTAHRWVMNGTGTATDTVGSASMTLVSGTAVAVTAIKPAFEL